jgi:hypothetical protein
MSKTLVNFLIDQSALDRFDAVTSMLNRTRTSVLLEMIGMFCSEQIIAVEQRNQKIQKLNDALTQQHILLSRSDQARQFNRARWPDEEEMGLPTAFLSDGHDNF